MNASRVRHHRRFTEREIMETTNPDDVRFEGRTVGKLLLSPSLNPYQDKDPRAALWLEGFKEGQRVRVFDSGNGRS
jgi:hypothetical protein